MFMKLRLSCLICGVVLSALVSQSSAAIFTQGDVFGAVSNGNVNWYRGDGTFVQTLSTGAGGFTTGMAFDSTGRLYVTNFSNGTIYRFNNDGSSDGAFAFNGFNSNESLVFDSAGNLFVGQADGTQNIRKLSATGTFIDEYDVAVESAGRGSDWIDLASDQTTMYYTSEGRRVLRYDVSTDTQLADFATLPGIRGPNIAFALRLLGDGGLLVADRANIKRLDSSGSLVQQYDDLGNDNWFALNLDPNGTSFWSGDSTTGELIKFSISTGAKEQTIVTGAAGSLFGVTVFGEITQSQPPGAVPEAGSLIAWLLVSCLVGCVAVYRRSTSKS